jgi:hypothetical protein
VVGAPNSTNKGIRHHFTRTDKRPIDAAKLETVQVLLEVQTVSHYFYTPVLRLDLKIDPARRRSGPFRGQVYTS